MDSSHLIFSKKLRHIKCVNENERIYESIDFHFDYRRLGVREFVAVGI